MGEEMSYTYDCGYKKCEKCGTLWKRNAECPHTDPVVVPVAREVSK